MANFQRFLSSTFKELKPDSWDKLIKAIDNRFNLLEESQDAQEKVASDILKRGLQVIEDGIGPSVIAAREAVEQIDDMTNFLSAHSTSELSIATGSIEFIINETERAYFKAPKFIIAYVPDDLDKWMSGQTQSWDKETGQLVVNITDIKGSGVYSDWGIDTTTIPAKGPTLDAYTKTEADILVAQAKAAAKTETKNEILGGVGPAFDTLQELATARSDDVDAVSALTSEVGLKENKSALKALAYKDAVGYERFTASRNTGAELHTSAGHFGVHVMDVNDGVAYLGQTYAFGGQKLHVNKTGYYLLTLKHYAQTHAGYNRLNLRINDAITALMTHTDNNTNSIKLIDSDIFYLNDGDWISYYISGGGWSAYCYHSYLHTQISGVYLGE